MWRTPANESRYSFYRIGWVNPESERTTEIKFPPWVGSNPQPFDRQSSVLPLSYHRSLVCNIYCCSVVCLIKVNFVISFTCADQIQDQRRVFVALPLMLENDAVDDNDRLLVLLFQYPLVYGAQILKTVFPYTNHRLKNKMRVNCFVIQMTSLVKRENAQEGGRISTLDSTLNAWELRSHTFKTSVLIPPQHLCFSS